MDATRECVNCGWPEAQRDGDKISCPKCKYTWTVELEQSMPQYFTSRGREAAQPSKKGDKSLTASKAEIKAGEKTVTVHLTNANGEPYEVQVPALVDADGNVIISGEAVADQVKRNPLADPFREQDALIGDNEPDPGTTPTAHVETPSDDLPEPEQETMDASKEADGTPEPHAGRRPGRGKDKEATE